MTATGNRTNPGNRTNLGKEDPGALEQEELLRLDARFVVSKLSGLEEYVVSLAR